MSEVHDRVLWTAVTGAPDLEFIWARVGGEYVVKGPARRTYSPYYVDAYPWPHCAKCDTRLRRRGERARCGRGEISTFSVSYEDAAPCSRCQETGRIWCGACCLIEQHDEALHELQEIGVGPIEFQYQRIMRREAGFCYFVHGVGTSLIKIGTSTDPEKRISDLQNMNAIPLRALGIFPGGREMEKRLHVALGDTRAHGEWFHDSQELRDTIRDLRVAHERLAFYDRILELRPMMLRGAWERELLECA